jgi:hypothetical protein
MTVYVRQQGRVTTSELKPRSTAFEVDRSSICPFEQNRFLGCSKLSLQPKTAFLVCRSHLETDHQLLSGCREDVLRKVNGAWKVARRTIVHGANVLLDKNLSAFL